MTLDTYISKLTDSLKVLPSEVKTIVESNETWILRQLRTRLYQTGIDGDDRLIGHYAASTVATKRANSQRASFITLRDRGDFYRGMFVELDNNSLIIDSNDEKTEKLISAYGPAILELTTQEQQSLIKEIIDPRLDELFNINEEVQVFDTTN